MTASLLELVNSVLREPLSDDALKSFVDMGTNPGKKFVHHFAKNDAFFADVDGYTTLSSLVVGIPPVSNHTLIFLIDNKSGQPAFEICYRESQDFSMLSVTNVKGMTRNDLQEIGNRLRDTNRVKIAHINTEYKYHMEENALAIKNALESTRRAAKRLALD